MASCLCCHKPAGEGPPYHAKCLRSLFGTTRAPGIPFAAEDLHRLALKAGGRMSVPGAHIKLLVRFDPETRSLEPAAEGSTHLLKPESRKAPELPANENLCMSIAADLGLSVPPHGLFRMADGRLCYVVRRFDRAPDGARLHVETLFQLLGTESKHKGSIEDAGRALRAHARNVGLDVLELFERVLLSFLLGNGEMHMRDMALLLRPDGSTALAPCVGLACTKMYVPAQEDSALTVNGKRTKLSPEDFRALAASLRIPPKAAENSLRRLGEARRRIQALCGESQLTHLMRQKLAYVLDSRYRRLLP